MEQQLLGGSAGGDGLPNGPAPDIPVPDVHLPCVPLPDVPLPDVPFPEVTLHEARPDGSVCEELTSARVAEEACVWVRVGFLSCKFPFV